MEESKDLGKLTIYEIFESTLGKQKANEILGKIQDGIDKGLRGEELEAHIYSILCDARLGDYKIYFPLPHVIPYVITGH